MSFVVTFDLFCDKCNCWRPGLGGPTKRIALRKAKSDGWEFIKEDGKLLHVCPACLGKISEWEYYYAPK